MNSTPLAPRRRPARTTSACALLGAAVLLLLALVVDAPDSTAGSWAYLVISVGGAIAAWTADRRRPENRRGRFPFVPITLTFNALGDVLWQVVVWVTGSAPDVSVADLAYLASYVALGATTMTGRLGGRPRAGARVYPALDGAAALAVALLVTYQTSIAGTLADHGEPALTRAVWIAYPVLDALLIGLFAWRVVWQGRLRPGAALLLAGALCWLASDLGWLVLADPDASTGWLDAGWLLGVLALAAVTWTPHNSSPEPAAGAVRSPAHGPWRMALNVAPFCAPAVLEVLGWVRGVDVNPVPGLVVWGVLLVITTVRTRLLAQDAERAWAAVSSQARRSEALVVNSSDATAVVGADGRLAADSRSLSRLLDVPAPAGSQLTELVTAVGADPRTVADLLSWTRSQPGVPVEVELAGTGPAGAPRWLGVRAVDLLADPDVAGIAVSVAEITLRKQAEHALAHQAFHDELTGLANRSLFLDRAEQALRRAARLGLTPVVLCLDLDGFKDVNDSLGHLAGDELLREVATRLTGVVRAHDTVARLGGDEFAVLVEDGPGTAAERATELADRLLAVLAAPIDLAGHRVVVGASVGIVVADPEATPLSLLQDGDIAMYRAKDAGRGQWAVFELGMRTAAVERMELERELAAALDEGQLRLVYQPVVHLGTGRVAGFEALLRWHHPVLGPVGPDRFVPVAEAAGLIVPIGRWVLEEATRTAARWQRAHPGRPLSMAVNVSAHQLADAGFVGEVACALATTGMVPSSLVLEVTETALVADPDAVALRLAELQTLGVRIALDDFGTGYSSLAYLRQFRVDVLKIDRSFVELLDGPAEEAAIVHGLVQLGRTLQLEVVAEGVERPAQHELLRAEGCQLGQGWLFSRPLEETDAELLLLSGPAPELPSAPAPELLAQPPV